MNKQLVTKSVMIIGLSCLSTLAFADLTIHNNTNEPSTCRTFGLGNCSTENLGSLGITPPHDKRTYSNAKIRIACKSSDPRKDGAEDCRAEVYMTNNCGGVKIATAYYGIKSGLKSTPVMEPGTNYVINGGVGSNDITIDYASN